MIVLHFLLILNLDVLELPLVNLLEIVKATQSSIYGLQLENSVQLVYLKLDASENSSNYRLQTLQVQHILNSEIKAV
jgi:hypothetical protein